MCTGELSACSRQVNPLAPRLPRGLLMLTVSNALPTPLPFVRYSGSTLTKLIATVSSGVAIGLTAAALQLAVDVASRRRNALLDRLLDAVPPAGPSSSSLGTLAGQLLLSGGLLHFFGALAALSVGIVLLLTLVVALWAPKAAGGGVALVMAFLNGKRPGGLLAGDCWPWKCWCALLARVLVSRPWQRSVCTAKLPA